MRKMDLSEFISRSKKVHGNKYDYSKSIYIDSTQPIKIICPVHGEFNQTAQSHYGKKYGCQKCSVDNQKNDNFISDAKKIHGDKYDYSLVEYKNNKVKVKIICPIHGIFKQRPNDHTIKNRGGCYKCGKDNMSNKSRKTNELFIKQSTDIHGGKYDYSLVEYTNCNNKVKVICKKHGVFNQTPIEHLSGCGCPKCKSSKGELSTREWLDKHNFNYIYQHKFDDCKNIGKLVFDFYLPEYNLCIEYDGEQHYKEKSFFGGEDGLRKTQMRDKIKDKYCVDNNILLLRIRYDEIIVDKLNKVLNQKNK